jgi:hypothetical protein
MAFKRPGVRLPLSPPEEKSLKPAISKQSGFLDARLFYIWVDIKVSTGCLRFLPLHTNNTQICDKNKRYFYHKQV